VVSMRLAMSYNTAPSEHTAQDVPHLSQRSHTMFSHPFGIGWTVLFPQYKHTSSIPPLYATEAYSVTAAIKGTEAPDAKSQH